MSGQPTDAVNENKVISEPSVPETRPEQEEQQAFNKFKRGTQGQLSMQIKVHSPFRVYYSGPAFSISAENATGPFDILPKHHNFIALLSPCNLIIRTVTQGNQKIRIAGGIMHVKADEVIVFLDV